MTYQIRELKENEYEILDDFLYEAIYIHEGEQAPSRDVINKPELQVYVKDFGSFKDDICFVAEVNNRIIGAVWVRIMEDYGHVDDDTPSFAISIYKDYRGQGIGRALMNTMLTCLKGRGYKKASLSVQKDNYAFHLYQSVGFRVLKETIEEYIMIIDL